MKNLIGFVLCWAVWVVAGSFAIAAYLDHSAEIMIGCSIISALALAKAFKLLTKRWF